MIRSLVCLSMVWALVLVPGLAPNRPPVVRGRCEPCTVATGATATVAADARDPDKNTLTYRWSAPAGTLARASARQTQWTAPLVEGPVPVAVRVEDGKGGVASDVVTIQVVKEPVKVTAGTLPRPRVP